MVGSGCNPKEREGKKGTTDWEVLVSCGFFFFFFLFFFFLFFLFFCPSARDTEGNRKAWGSIVVARSSLLLLGWEKNGGLNTYKHPRRGEFSRVDLSDGFSQFVLLGDG